jgi:hypothetical protein
MQRLIKGFAVGIFCLQWSLPASAQDPPATCESVTKNPSPLTNTSLTQLDANGTFQQTCTCPSETTISGGFIKLSIVPVPTMTRNGLATIMLPSGTVSTNEIVNIPYQATTSYAVNVSAPTGETLQSGDYLVAVSFELSTSPRCAPGGD